MFGLLGASALAEAYVEVRMAGALARSFGHFSNLFTYLRLASIAATAGAVAATFAGNATQLAAFQAAMVYFKWLVSYYYLQPLPLVGPVIRMVVAILFDILDILFVACTFPHPLPSPPPAAQICAGCCWHRPRLPGARSPAPEPADPPWPRVCARPN